MATRVKVVKLANPLRKRRKAAKSASPRRRKTTVKRHRSASGRFVAKKRVKAASRRRKATSASRTHKRRNPSTRTRRRVARVKRTVKRAYRHTVRAAKAVTRRIRRAAATHRRKSSRIRRRNPAPVLITLGAVNPTRRKNSMSRKATRRRNSTRVSVVSSRKNSRRRRNPVLFGQHMRPVELGKTVLGGLIGVTVAKLIPPMLPGSLTSSPALRVLVTGAVAFGAGMAAGKVNPQFGSAVTFGGLMQAVSTGLNAFVPSIGSQIGLNGMRGMGDLVPGSFPMPQNPVNFLPPVMAAPVAAPRGVAGGRMF